MLSILSNEKDDLELAYYMGMSNFDIQNSDIEIDNPIVKDL